MNVFVCMLGHLHLPSTLRREGCCCCSAAVEYARRSPINVGLLGANVFSGDRRCVSVAGIYGKHNLTKLPHKL